MDMQNIIDYLKKRFFVVLAFGLVFAIGLSIEKIFFTNFIIKSGDFLFTRIVSINEVSKSDTKIYSEFHYGRLMNTYPVIKEFQEYSKSKYDFGKFDATWNNKTEQDRYKWQQNHIYINEIGNNIYEICIHFGKNDYKDYEYTKNNANQLLTDYIIFSNRLFNEMGLNMKTEEYHNFSMYPQEIILNKRLIVIKYFIIGFLLGSLLGMAILLVKYNRNRNYGNKLS